MLSTLLNYRLYASDLPKTLARIEADAAVKRDAQYYADNIGDVETVDDFLGDYRLYSHALKAYGLAEQIRSPAFVRQILDSDLSDASSFANRLSDPRYRAFAAAFDFSAASAEPAIQSQAQTDRLVEAYSEHLVRGGSLAAQKASAFEARIGDIASVDEFLADPVLFEMTAKIAGLDPATASRTYMRGILAGGGEGGAALPEPFAFLASAFSFEQSGASGTAGAQTAAQTAEFITRYFAAAGQGNSSQAAAFEGRYFETQIGSMSTVEDFLEDETLFRVVRISAGLVDGDATRATLFNLFSLPADHPDNPIAKLSADDPAQAPQRAKLVALKEAFNFEAGEIAPGQDTIGAAPLAKLMDDFYAGYPTTSASDIALRTNSFRVQLSKMDTLNDLLGKDPVYGNAAFDYILKAFDIDPSTESNTKIRRVLTSDPSDPNSYVRKLGDPRYDQLAAAFNFDAQGKVRTERLVQSVRTQQETAALYAASFGTEQSDDQKATVRQETIAYLGAVGGITSLENLLADDTVLDFALRAHGLTNEDLTKDELRRLVTSDLTDPQSFARSFADKRYEDFVGSFNFTPDGVIALSGGSVQDAQGFLTTQNLYLLQMLEEEAGATSEGTRLALYFLRKSPDIKSAFSILGDRALFEVVRTALGLPESMSQLDIDRQAAILEARVDFTEFQDAGALDKFISRFAALYDMNNPGTGGGADPILALFGSGGGNSGSARILGLF